MKDGFVKIACATPDVRVADCKYNAEKITELIFKASERGAKLIVFPELSLTGYTCGDLFFQDTLIRSAGEYALKVAEDTKDCDIISIVGLPVICNNKLYNCAGVINNGDLSYIVPKMNIPENETRYFASGKNIDYCDSCYCDYLGLGLETEMVFKCSEIKNFSFGIEIGEDLFVAESPSINLVKHGASLIVNLSCTPETVGKAEYRRNNVKAKSLSLICAYAYAESGIGESTTDMVFAGHNIIAENGSIIAESERFENQIIYTDVDFKKIESERRRSSTFETLPRNSEAIFCKITSSDTKLERNIPQLPFIPSSKDELAERCNEIHKVQAVGLMSRLKRIGCKNAVLGLSGGLDSTLALIVTVNAFDMLGLDRKNITAVTMPCFGTTDRTYNNACNLAQSYGVTLKEVNIKDSVRQHFKDIGQDENVHDVTYENAQARERTQVLMDIANQNNGLVVGTGDLSELALGWATYNGDHMSMYGVNASVPKTLVRYLTAYEAERQTGILKDVLFDILDTPVSPELLPPQENGEIKQKTEDIVGPYELHDFFLFYMLRYGFSPSKIYRMACHAFKDVYDKETVLKWEKVFYKRFFTQQFKRSCLPDGVKVGSVTLSPRGDFKMPSDAYVTLWLEELETI